MPKQKTHSGAKKRFKVTGSGALKREGAKMRHNLEKKPTRVTSRLSKDKMIKDSDKKGVKKLLGI